MTAPVEIHPYDPVWPALFEQEQLAIRSACGDWLLEVHHVGSTAVPGLAAKPVIDILAILARHDDGLACVPAMKQLGYEYRGANGINGRHYFSKGRPHSHHVHMLAADHDEAARLLRFRDHLRSHPEDAQAYEALKRGLAQRFAADRSAYTEAKSAFCLNLSHPAGG